MLNVYVFKISSRFLIIFLFHTSHYPLHLKLYFLCPQIFFFCYLLLSPQMWFFQLHFLLRFFNFRTILPFFIFCYYQKVLEYLCLMLKYILSILFPRQTFTLPATGFLLMKKIMAKRIYR